MNTYVLCLKGVNKDMTTFEFEELWKLYLNEDIALKNIKNTYYYFTTNINIRSDNPIFSRLTLTNTFGKLLFKGKDFEEFKKTLEKINFSHLENKSFAIVQEYLEENQIIESKYLASPIWNQLKNPRVDLRNPDFTYISLNHSNEIYFIEVIFQNEKGYLKRMPKLRPVAKPYTLKSDMARVGVNYLGIKEGLVLDPFCGIGGILLEAYDMGFVCYGNDISWNDIQHMKTNFNFYYPNYKLNLSICDAREQFLKDDSMDGIVTDIPYGRASRKLGLDLYEKFLYNSSKMLKKGHRMVVIYANFVEFREIALEYFDEVKQINQYINKSMTRHILILENSKKNLNKKI